MKTYFDCIPCFVRQTLDAARLVTNDEKVHEQVLRKVLKLASEMDMNMTPPAMAQKIHRIIRKMTKTVDPYKKEKQKFNEFALKLLPKFQKLIAESKKPLEIAVRLAIAGNIIDLGVKCSIKLDQTEKIINQALTDEFDLTDFDDFKRQITEAKKILYLADNAGEIVFDRLLIEQINPKRITLVVRGMPIINDATIEDAKETGLTELVETIDNGDDAPGTILKSCSCNMKKRFDEADLVIAKGQGNFETLSDVEKKLFFILKAKCPVVAQRLNCKIGALVLKRK